MKVYWTDQAKAQLRTIHDYMASTSPDYARRMIDRLTRRSEQIGAFPQSGRVVPEFDIELVREILEGPYRIIYTVRQERVDVLAVIHGARKVLLDK